jgi:outer membrane protein OmpA-like peptidoglycan-associated protein
MKNRIFAVLLVAVLVTVSAVAQQTASSNTQAAAPAAAPAQNATGKQPLTVETKEGFWGKINPFARKKYVQRQLAPVADRLNELDELTANNTKNIKDVDGRAQEGIRLAASKANEADQHAIDAGNRANAAQATAQQANTRLTTVEQAVGNIDQYKPITQTEIHFKSGQTVLSKNAKEALDGMATTLKNQRGYVVEVQGFAAGHGQAAIANSQKMADAVVRYLVLNHEIPVYRIFVVGMGNAPKTDADGKTVRITGGRVEVSLLKNNLDQLATADQPQAK